MGMGRGGVSRGHQAPAGARLRVGSSGNAHHARHGTPRPRASESTSPPPAALQPRPPTPLRSGLRPPDCEPMGLLWLPIGPLLAIWCPFAAAVVGEEGGDNAA